MNGTLQAHVLVDRDRSVVEPIACPLGDRVRVNGVYMVHCARYDHHEGPWRRCPHLEGLAHADDHTTRTNLIDLTIRAAERGARQARCTVICSAARVPAAPGVQP